MNKTLSRRLLIRFGLASPFVGSASALLAKADEIQQAMESELVPDYLPRSLRVKLDQAAGWFEKSHERYSWDEIQGQALKWEGDAGEFLAWVPLFSFFEQEIQHDDASWTACGFVRNPYYHCISRCVRR
ncbi:MAG: hypothetical protein KDA96_07585, partial [Planctomycetaceae bacterium]|nr:hypothetical protein [Planctomycetaceae bacterium]